MTSTDTQYAAAAENLEVSEVPARRQPGHLVELILADREDLVTVRVTNVDRIAYEKTAARHREWPAAEVGQHFAMTFVCWSAARRAGLTTQTFEQWEATLLDYDIVQDAPADPTRPSRSPGGTSN